MIQAMLIMLIVTLPVMYGLRKLLGTRVQALMLRTSAKAEPAPSISGDVEEVKAPVALLVVELDRESQSAQNDKARHAGAQEGRSLFLRWCVYDAIAVTGALAICHLALRALVALPARPLAGQISAKVEWSCVSGPGCGPLFGLCAAVQGQRNPRDTAPQLVPPMGNRSAGVHGLLAH
jgi:hypothetical protein